MGSKGDLVARSAATTPPATKNGDDLAVELEALKIREMKKAPKCSSAATKMSEPTSPEDYFQLHRIRNSALAGKTRTMSNFGGDQPELYDELRGLSISDKPRKEKPKTAAEKNLKKEESKDSGNEEDEDDTNSGQLRKKKDDKDSGKETTEEGEEEEGEGELIGRTPGPVASARQGRLPNNYPYNAPQIKRGPKPVIPPGAVIQNPADFWKQQQMKGTPINGFGPGGQTYEPYALHQQDVLYNYYKSGGSSGGSPLSEPAKGYGMGPEAAFAMNGNGAQSYSPCATDEAPTHSPSCALAASEGKFSVMQTSGLPESPFADGVVPPEELSRLLDSPPEPTELPDNLSDFILKYSRRYSCEASPTGLPITGPLSAEEGRSVSRKSSDSDSDSSASSSPRHNHVRHLEEPPVCVSPASAGSAPQPSPAQPKGAASPTLPGAQRPSPVSVLPANLSPPVSARKGSARDRLRKLFGEKENEIACLWAVKCIQSCPGALYFRDPDGDSLLHIVVWHKDLPKIYALVELMLKTEYNHCQKPFDLPNRLHETPLYLAVQKREEEVVSYLLECGANPNFQTRKVEADAPLHYAAARGMTEIVDVLAAAPGTDLNLRNGIGLTPLLCAVKNHGVIEEESQCLVNNKPTIRALLKAGADPKVPEAGNGKTVVHYAVDRMDPELVDIYRDNLSPEVMRAVVNIPCFEGETPLGLLQRLGAPTPARAPARLQAEEELRQKMMLALVAAGAVPPVQNSHVPTSPNSPYDSFDN